MRYLPPLLGLLYFPALPRSVGGILRSCFEVSTGSELIRLV